MLLLCAHSIPGNAAGAEIGCSYSHSVPMAVAVCHIAYSRPWYTLYNVN